MAFLAAIGAIAASAGGCGSSGTSPSDAGSGGAGTGAGGRAGTGGSTGTPDGGGVDSVVDGARTSDAGPAQNLGKACTTDYDCMNGLVCLRANGNDYFDLAGPAHGYCSAPCTSLTDQKCSDIGGTCTDISPTQAGGHSYYCFQSCVLGSPPEGKCQGRTDVACAPTTNDITSTAGVCTPTCSSDAECPAGRTCEFSICVSSGVLPTRDPVGMHCATPTDPTDPTTDTCTGSTFCITLQGNQNFCTEPCVLGSAVACAFVDQTMSLANGAHGICLGAITQNPMDGDLGFCFQQCDTMDQCLDQTDPGLLCDTTNPGLGHGFCSWN